MNEIVTVEEKIDEKETLEFSSLELNLIYKESELIVLLNSMRDKKEKKYKKSYQKLLNKLHIELSFYITKILYTNDYINFKLPNLIIKKNNNIILPFKINKINLFKYLELSLIIPIILNVFKNYKINLTDFSLSLNFLEDFQNSSLQTFSLNNNSFNFLIFKDEFENFIQINICNEKKEKIHINLNFYFNEEISILNFKNINALIIDKKSSLYNIVFNHITFDNTTINGFNIFEDNSNHYNIITKSLSLENYNFFNFNLQKIYIKDAVIEEITIIKCKFNKQIYFYFFKDSTHRKHKINLSDIFFLECVFDNNIELRDKIFTSLEFRDCIFNKGIRLIDCKIKDHFYFDNCTINEHSSFLGSYFYEDLFLIENSFNNALNLSNILVAGIFDISTSSIDKLIFNNLNFLKENINYINNEVENNAISLYEYKDYFNSIINRLKNNQNEIIPNERYILTNIKSSFAMLKNACLANNNIIDANFFHALELLFYKAELSKRSIFEKIEYKELIPESIDTKKLIDENIIYDNYISQSKEAISWFSKINGRLFTDKILLFLNEFISNHHQNTFRAIFIWLGFGFISSSILYNSFNYLKSDGITLKTWKELFLEITFPFYSAPDGIFMGIFKIISVYIIWQIIKSARNSFR